MTQPDYREKARDVLRQEREDTTCAFGGRVSLEQRIAALAEHAHLAGRREGSADGYRRGIEAAERCGHRSEPQGISDEAARGYWDACEDILTDIRALLRGGKDGSGN